MVTNANSRQVGGTHYHNGEMPQHWDIVIAMGWDYLIGNATKYIWRLGKKNPSVAGQIEDIDKAMHYLQKKKEVLQAEYDHIRMTRQEVKWSDPIHGPEEDEDD